MQSIRETNLPFINLLTSQPSLINAMQLNGWDDIYNIYKIVDISTLQYLHDPRSSQQYLWYFTDDLIYLCVICCSYQQPNSPAPAGDRWKRFRTIGGEIYCFWIRFIFWVLSEGWHPISLYLIRDALHLKVEGSITVSVNMTHMTASKQ